MKLFLTPIAWKAFKLIIRHFVFMSIGRFQCFLMNHLAATVFFVILVEADFQVRFNKVEKPYLWSPLLELFLLQLYGVISEIPIILGAKVWLLYSPKGSSHIWDRGILVDMFLFYSFLVYVWFLSNKCYFYALDCYHRVWLKLNYNSWPKFLPSDLRIRSCAARALKRSDF